MLEAYRIGTTYTLNDLVTPRLLEMSKHLFKVDGHIVGLQKRLKQLGVEQSGIRVAARAARDLDVNMARAQMQAATLGHRLEKLKVAGALSGNTKALHSEFAKADKAAAGLGASLSMIGTEAAGIDAVTASARALSHYLKQAGGHAGNLHAQLAQIKAMGALPQMPGIPRIAGGGYGGGRRGGGHGPVHGGNVHIGPGGVGMGGVGVGIADMVGGPGMAALAVGYGAYAMTTAGVRNAAEYQREQAQFSMFGMSAAQNAEAKRYAEQMKAPGASLIDKMRYMTEAQGVFRESGMSGDEALSGAKLVAPILAKLHYGSLLSGKEMSEADEKSMLRFIETRGGLKDPKELARIADLGYKVTMTSGGNVDWEQMRQAARTGGIAAKGLSDEALFAWGEPLIGEMKGGPFGTGLSTAFNRMNGIVKLPNQAYHEMERLGLWDRRKVIENSQGGIKAFRGNPLKWADEYQSNPFKYYVDHIMPMYDKLKLSEGERDRENALLFGGTGSRLFSTLEQQLPTIKRSLPALQTAAGLDNGVSVSNKTFDGQMKQFEAAWSDYKTQFGTSVLPTTLKIIEAGSWILRYATKFDADAAAEKAYVDQGGSFWNRIKRTFSWEDGNAPQQQPDKTVAPAQSAHPTTAHITVQVDGKDLSKHVASVMFKPTHSGAALGSGLFDPGLGMRNSLNGY